MRKNKADQIGKVRERLGYRHGEWVASNKLDQIVTQQIKQLACSENISMKRSKITGFSTNSSWTAFS